MLKAITQKIQLAFANDGGDRSLKSKLIKGAAGSFGIKIATSGLGFITSIVFARFLGTAGLGTYAYAISWANLLSIPATLGFDQLIVREIAVYRARSQWSLMRGLISWSNLMVLGSSVALTIVAIAVVWILPGNLEPNLAIAITLAMITVPIASLRNLRMGAMKGLHHVVLGEIPDALIAPTIVVCLTCAVYLLFPDSNVYWVLGIKIFAIAISFVIGILWLRRSLPLEVRRVGSEYQSKQWLSAALPFMFLGTTHLINSRIDVLMLGAIRGVEAVGIYTIIAAITKLTIFIHQAVNSVLAPTIATLYSENKLQQLERIIRKSVLIVFSISLLIGVTMIVMGKYLLLIFGSEFVPGQTAMSILIIGQIFNALTGPVGLVLNMTGHQNYTAITLGTTAVLNIVLNATFIPLWGINGAAIATTISLILTNILNVIFLQKTLNIFLFSFKLKN